MMVTPSPTLFSAHSRDDMPGPALKANREAGTGTSRDRRLLERWIAAHPVISVTTALVFGAIVGWFVKRR